MDTERLILRPLKLADAQAIRVVAAAACGSYRVLQVNDQVLKRTPGFARSSTVNSNTSGRA